MVVTALVGFTALASFTALFNSPLVNGLLYQLFIFAISIVVLSKASHVIIKNSVEIAKITKLGELVIGFILLSLATNIPEFAVAFSAIVSENIEITIGNLLGSNIANIGLALAIPAIMSPIAIKKGTFEKLPLMMFLSSIIPFAFLATQELGKLTGIVLILTFVFFAYYSIKKKISLRLPKKRSIGILKSILMPLEFYKSLFFLCISMVIVFASASFVVSSASKISSFVGVSEYVIGATVISIGTTLPELAVSLTAVKTKHFNLAIGNIIGSCLTKITLILGIVLLVSPATINIGIFSTLLFFVVGSKMVAWYFFMTGRKLDRTEGTVLLFIYILFIISTFGVQLVLIK